MTPNQWGIVSLVVLGLYFYGVWLLAGRKPRKGGNRKVGSYLATPMLFTWFERVK